jgi:3-oxoacyl-[acyl-carrier protein] reductase
MSHLQQREHDMSSSDRNAPGAHPLSGKVVLVTGGSRGIGAAMARRFAAAGSRVAIGYRSGNAAAEAVLGEIKAVGAQGVAVAGDIAKPEEARAMVAQVVAEFGHIDVLVNCAGIGEYRPFEKTDPAFFHAIFDTNVLGTVAMIQAALPHLTAPGGRIINFSSGLATRPIPTSSIYAASKAAVAALSHALAKEFGPRGITVNTIAPGVIETEMTTAILAERGPGIVAMTPLGRIGQTDDIAGIALFLASPDADWLTGRTIIADGGVS